MQTLSQIVGQLQTQRKQVQSELQRLDAAIAALRGLGTSNGAGKLSVVAPVRRKLSAAARKKIATAQRARWAAWRAKKSKQEKAA